MTSVRIQLRRSQGLENASQPVKVDRTMKSVNPFVVAAALIRLV